jgi:hydroxypyruvate isomerase
MPVFAANLTMMFTEWAFLDRFAAAADAGFPAVEYLFPYDFAAEAIQDRLTHNGLKQALFNMPPGDWTAGERGLAALPNRFDEFRSGVSRALDYAEATGVKKIHMMAGIADAGDATAIASYRRALEYAAGRLAEKSLDLLLEPINGRNMPGYFLDSFDSALQVIESAGLPNVRLQFDIYHCQILHGDVTMRLRRDFSHVGHVQIASIPSRHEPDGEELNYPFLFSELDRLGYAGYVGCEYNPRGETVAGLGWFEPYRRRS